MNRYRIIIIGNDTLAVSAEVRADTIEEAITIICTRVGRCTIEQFVEVSAKLIN